MGCLLSFLRVLRTHECEYAKNDFVSMIAVVIFYNLFENDRGLYTKSWSLSFSYEMNYIVISVLASYSNICEQIYRQNRNENKLIKKQKIKNRKIKRCPMTADRIIQ